MSEALENVFQFTEGTRTGRYQKLLFVGMLPFAFFFAYVLNVHIFITAVPSSFWCHVPALENLSMDMRRELALPPAEDESLGGDPCRTYDVDWKKVVASKTPPANNTPTIACVHGWEYDYSDVPFHTIATERAWVCDKAHHIPAAYAVFFLGASLGSVFFGWLADRHGRIPGLIGANLMAAVGGIGTIYTTGFWDFFVCRFISGLAIDSCFMLFYILVIEWVDTQERSVVVNKAIAFFLIGGCVPMPFVAMLIKDWRKFMWVSSAPLLMVVVTPWFVPESIRWLISNHRIDEAVEMFQKMAKANKRRVPDEVMKKLVKCSETVDHSGDSLVALYKSVPLRYTMIVNAIVFVSASVVYAGMMVLSGDFNLDVSYTFGILSLVEFPGAVILVYMLDSWGRNCTTFVTMIFAGISTLSTTTVPKVSLIVRAVVTTMSRFYMSMCYYTVMLWITEVLPTTVRASASGSLHSVAFFITTLSPLVTFSKSYDDDVPFIILGVMALLTAGVAALLPESAGLPLPLNIPDGERIIMESRICGLIFTSTRSRLDRMKSRSLASRSVVSKTSYKRDRTRE